MAPMILILALIAYFMWRTLKLMPKTKPQEITAEVEGAGHVRRRRRGRRDQGRAPGGRRLPLRPEAVQAARRQGPEGHPAARPARHRQDPARQGGRPRVGRELLQPVRVVVRRDVRGPRRGADPAPVQGGARERARDRLHRRARRGRRPARLRHLRRARPDPEPAPGRDGRLQRARGRGRDGRLEHAREARQGAAAPGPVRPPGVRAAARHARAAIADPRGPHASRSRSPRTSTWSGSPATPRA